MIDISSRTQHESISNNNIKKFETVVCAPDSDHSYECTMIRLEDIIQK